MFNLQNIISKNTNTVSFLNKLIMNNLFEH